ncbi:EF-hand calcium-binding domain-containing protein 2-like [Haliotis rubra]|uniref:EF-hand calcium-binding domain-containing protein 2-like n=1 Tax=Haliotis rubra TaxID=36100 RepID=UPI001EE5F7CF|nr:EF-hand calcium-binding domain-containing protein 2-like [Haliotis rubra]
MKLVYLLCLTAVLVVMGTDGWLRVRFRRFRVPFRTLKPFIKPVLGTVAKTYFGPYHTGIKVGCGLYRKFTGREIRALDANTDGLVDRSEAASYFGVDHSDAQLDHFMNMADAKRDGTVDLDEFFDAALAFEDEGPESAP